MATRWESAILVGGEMECVDVVASDDGWDDDDASDDNAVDLTGSDVAEDAEEEEPSSGGARNSGGKLWGTELFPSGVHGAANWDLANLAAAQKWECPCKDRTSCISAERMPNVLELYEYRKTFQLTAHKDGGLRDGCRKELDSRRDPTTNSFTRSFKVGNLVDCCASSAALAKGVSFGTYSDARSDSRKERAHHDGRVDHTTRAESEARAHLEAVVRQMRETMEGPKGGSAVTDMWRTSKVTVPDRWTRHKADRVRNALPVIGSLALFTKIWKAHDEIIEIGAKGHPKCDDCGKNAADRQRAVDNNDKEGVKRVDALQARHDKEHLGERAYAEDIWLKGENQPRRVTALSMDAPTETQLDVPVQERRARDPVKSLETQPKWQTKLMGVMIAGFGMLCFAVRAGLGVGPNLSCTVLYLTLGKLVEFGFPIGQRVSVLLDNTGEANKNNVMFFFLAWLVLTHKTEEAGCFFMIKGHTYSRIDQSFRTMIRSVAPCPSAPCHTCTH